MIADEEGSGEWGVGKYFFAPAPHSPLPSFARNPQSAIRDQMVVRKTNAHAVSTAQSHF
jgi:hypothetical protein